MSAPAADPAGSIQVQLLTRDGRVATARLSSTRPTGLARRLFAGRPVDHLLATLPRVFSVCATAQAAAAVQAVERAAAIDITPLQAQARDLLVLTETAREHLFRILLGWSGWLGSSPGAVDLGALGRMRAGWLRALYPGGDAFRPGGGELVPDRGMLDALLDDLEGLTVAALGGPPGDWPGLWSAASTDAALLRWARTDGAVAQRMLGRVLGEGHAGLGASPVTGLPDLDPGALAARLGAADGDAFVCTPQWDGAPHETGALQRQWAQPLVAACRARHGNALLTRQVARLSELAGVVVGIRGLVDALATGAGPDAPPPPPQRWDGVGIAQVEAARGRLVHWVRLAGGVVDDYRILAPTEWNFHPRGALAQGLLTLPADDRLPHLAQLLVDAVDPCVACQVTVTADA